MAKTLHQVKQENATKAENNKSKKNVTDADYVLRDKKEEASRGYPNTVDMTPKAKPATRGK